MGLLGKFVPKENQSLEEKYANIKANVDKKNKTEELRTVYRNDKAVAINEATKRSSLSPLYFLHMASLYKTDQEKEVAEKYDEYVRKLYTESNSSLDMMRITSKDEVDTAEERSLKVSAWNTAAKELGDDFLQNSLEYIDSLNTMPFYEDSVSLVDREHSLESTKELISESILSDE